MYQERIEKLLNDAFMPSYLAVINESHQHRTTKGSESHFKIIIVSAEFNAMSALQRHRAVYRVLAEPLQNGVHALALHTLTPEEWQLKEQKVADSPRCSGQA